MGNFIRQHPWWTVVILLGVFAVIGGCVLVSGGIAAVASAPAPRTAPTPEPTATPEPTDTPTPTPEPTATPEPTDTPTPTPELAAFPPHELPVGELEEMLEAVSADPYASSLTDLIGEHCDVGGICPRGDVGGWKVQGPAALMTDPCGDVITGTMVIKTYQNVNDGRFGVLYIPDGQTITIPTPGRAAILEGPLPEHLLH